MTKFSDFWIPLYSRYRAGNYGLEMIVLETTKRPLIYLSSNFQGDQCFEEENVAGQKQSKKHISTYAVRWTLLKLHYLNYTAAS